MIITGDVSFHGVFLL